MKIELALIGAACFGISACAESHSAPEPFTVPDARPACLRFYGADTLVFLLGQRGEAADSCVLVSLTLPAPRGEPFSREFPAITGPVNYSLDGIARLSATCNRARAAPEPTTTPATAGSGRVAVRYVPADFPDPGGYFVSASLDLTFPAAPDGSLPASVEHFRASEVDGRHATDECRDFGL